MTLYKAKTKDKITCPRCNYVFDNSHDMVLGHYGYENMRCPKCNIDILVESKIVYTTKAEVNDG